MSSTGNKMFEALTLKAESSLLQTVTKLLYDIENRSNAAKEAIRQPQSLSIEQERIQNLRQTFADIKSIQALLSKIETDFHADEDKITAAAQIAEISSSSIALYDARYGELAEARFADLRRDACDVLIHQLESRFRLDDVLINSDGICQILRRLGQVDADGSGIQYFAEILRRQFCQQVNDRRRTLTNVQLPFSGQLSVVYDLASSLLTWNKMNLDSHEVVGVCLLGEVGQQTLEIVGDFINNVLRFVVSDETRLLDVALSEAASLSRQIIVFAGQFLNNRQDQDDTFDKVRELFYEAHRTLTSHYFPLEEEYLRSSIQTIMAQPMNVLDAAEDVAYIFNKCFRRSLCFEDVGCLSGLLTIFVEEVEMMISGIKQSGAYQSDRANAMCTLLECVQDTQERISRFQTADNVSCGLEMKTHGNTTGIAKDLRRLNAVKSCITSSIDVLLENYLNLTTIINELEARIKFCIADQEVDVNGELKQIWSIVENRLLKRTDELSEQNAKHAIILFCRELNDLLSSQLNECVQGESKLVLKHISTFSIRRLSENTDLMIDDMFFNLLKKFD